jgi:N-ethylmaleimide reductase
MGRQSHSSYHAVREIVAPSAIAKNGHIRNSDWVHEPYETPRAFETKEVEAVVQDYVSTAKLAKEAGFDGVEIHAANGYLIDLFLQSSTNKRTDK